VLIGGLLALVPLVGTFIVFGYAFEVTRRAYEHNDALPEWDDFGGYLVRGFVGWAGIFIWMLPLFAIMFCAFIPAIILADSTEGASLFIPLAGVWLIIPLSLVLQAVVVPILFGRYALDRDFAGLFDFRAIYADIRRAGVGLLLVLAVTLGAQFVAQVGFLACCIGIVFTAFYAQLVVAHATGQLFRTVRADQAAGPATPLP
jgi:hypothetical protein